MTLQIRLATPEDSAAAIHVIQAVYAEYGFTWDPDDYHADLYDLQAYYLGPGHPFWIAELDGEPVGTVAMEQFETLPGRPGEAVRFDGKVRLGGCDGSVERLYVHPLARRRGVARALMAELLCEAGHRHRTYLEVWSDKRFEAAHALYGVLGANTVAERVCDDPDESPEWGLLLPVGTP